MRRPPDYDSQLAKEGSEFLIALVRYVIHKPLLFLFILTVEGLAHYLVARYLIDNWTDILSVISQFKEAIL